MSDSLLDIIYNIGPSGWIVFGGSVLAFILSGVVYWQDIKKRSSRYFFFFGTVNAFWGYNYAIFNGSLNTPGVAAHIAPIYTLAALMTFSYFLFAYVFADEKVVISFKKLILLFIPFFAVYLILKINPNFIIAIGSSQADVQGDLVIGKGFPLYILYMVGYIIAGTYVLIRKYKESAGIYKRAVRNLAISAFIISMGSVIFSVTLSVFFNHKDPYWLNHLSVFLLACATTYILAKYNYWNFKVMATSYFVSLIAIVIVLELFLATSITDLLLKLGIAILIIFSSSFLVGSVKREIQSKDRITRLLRDLDVAAKRLKILDKKKTEFLSIASHHLRDPLTAIKGYASMLAEGSFGELSRPVKDAVDKIFISSGHLITMISDFMDISRIESGDMNYNFKDVDMRKLVSDVVDGLKQNAERINLEVHLVLDDKPLTTVGDAGKLRQVISNLIDNSIKYTPAGNLFISLTENDNGKKILFSLTDTGIGMSPMTLEKIFNKFSRADGVSKVYTEGTGLGLYVAKEVVKKHEGRIWAESRGEGMGSSFYVELEAKHLKEA